MKLRNYKNGTPIDLSHALGTHAAVVEVELDDGRTVQMVVRHDGAVDLRAWGNSPMRLGNGNKTAIRFVVAHEPATCDDHGQPLDLRK